MKPGSPGDNPLTGASRCAGKFLASHPISTSSPSHMAEVSPSPLIPLYNLDGYRRYFTDAAYWAPFVSLIGERHGFDITDDPRSGLPGTFPTFIVSDRWVIKFFGPLFDGLSCFQVEQTASHLLPPQTYPVPTLLASGLLFPPGSANWTWPYLIYEYVSAPSIGEVYSQVSYSSKLALARQLGVLLQRIHRISLPAVSSFSPNWQSYLTLLTRQMSGCLERHTTWGSLPERMLSEIPSYLLQPSELIPYTLASSIIHADLTRDHLLGYLLPNGEWKLQAIIDFGDAISGDLFYELVVLHLEIFDTDLHLLRSFLETY
ncbi:MAG TPA: aminoglycoside phosphotransferase family protein, partial [Anaerolineales bacterium]|nr:aminoglycoside phosphotransferase family protein [Anaerolineales bacterium]